MTNTPAREGMPELPVPKFWWKPPTDTPLFYYNDSDVMRANGFTTLFTADQMHAYAVAYAAALSQPVQGGGDAAMESWHSAVNDASELFSNAPDQRFASRASRVLTYLKATPPPPSDAAQGVQAVRVDEAMVEKIVANVKKWMGPVGQDIGVAHTATLRGTITDAIRAAHKGEVNG